MADCLDNIIGIDKLCTPESPASGLWVQDLPGITLQTAGAATDEETASGIALIREKINIAKKAIFQDAIEFLLPKVRTNSLIESDTVGIYKEDLEKASAEALYLTGKKLKIQNYPYLEFYIESLSIKLDAVVTSNIFIYDLLTNTILDTIAFTSVAGVPVEVYVKKSYPVKGQTLSLAILYDSNLAGSYKTNLHLSGCNNCQQGYSNRYSSFDNIKILTANSKIEANVVSDNTNGLSVNYSINCSIESLICKMAKVFAWALLHKTGAELMRELQFSRRLNSIVILDKKDHIELRTEFENEYAKSMNRILDNIRIPHDVCFDCNQRVKTIVRIP
jgi:hypothetical protein